MMLRSVRVRDLMTPDVEAVALQARPSEVRALLERRAWHHLPVVDGERLVGILSPVDLARVSLAGYLPDSGTVDAHLDASFKLADLISVDLVTVRPDDTGLTAAERLAQGGFHALPVVEEGGRLVGIVTSTDLLRWMVVQG